MTVRKQSQLLVFWTWTRTGVRQKLYPPQLIYEHVFHLKRPGIVYTQIFMTLGQHLLGVFKQVIYCQTPVLVQVQKTRSRLCSRTVTTMTMTMIITTSPKSSKQE